MKPDRWLAIAMALCLGGASLDASAKTKPARRPTVTKVQPDIVGQVMAARPVDPKARRADIPVTILRGRERIETVTNHASLYPGDLVSLKAGATVAIRLVIYGGKEIILRSSPSGEPPPPFVVPGGKTGWTVKGLVRLLTQFPDIFDAPKGRPPVLTTPNGTKGSAMTPVAPADLLPAAPQTLRVGQGRVAIPVVWSGGPAMVRLSRQCRVEVEREFSARPGFVELRSARLADDDYCIDVWPIDAQRRPDRAAGFSIPVKVTIEAPVLVDEETAVLAAATLLRGPPGGRLQGLVDLDAQAGSSFKAWAIYHRIADGEYSIAAPRRSRR